MSHSDLSGCDDIVPNSCDEESLDPDSQQIYSINIGDVGEYSGDENSDGSIHIHNEIDTLINDMSFDEGAESDSQPEIVPAEANEPQNPTQEHIYSDLSENGYDDINNVNIVPDVNSSILDSSVSTDHIHDVIPENMDPEYDEIQSPVHAEGSSQGSPLRQSPVHVPVNVNESDGDGNRPGAVHGDGAGADDEDEDDPFALDLATDLDNLYCREEEPLDPVLNPLLLSEIAWRESEFEPIHVHQFTGSGEVHLPDNFDTSKATALDYWKLTVTNETIAKIVENTNSYFRYKLQQKRITQPDYVDRTWFDLSAQECNAFLGMSIVMAVSGVKRYRYIWSSNKYIRNEGLSSVMTLNRYAKISEYFHVSDRESEIASGLPGHDKLAKIRWFIDEIHDKFKQVKSPDKNQAIDESIIKFSGRVEFRQWNSAKPIRSGLKVFARTDASTGFVHVAQLYLGSRNTKSSKMGLYFDVINNLCKDIRWKNHHVYFDNLYSSVPLIKFLYTKQIYSVGTLRANRRHLPPLLRSTKQSKLLRGECKVFQDPRLSNLTCCLWKDVKDVKICGTNAVPGLSANVVRRVGGRQIQVPMPTIVQKYSQNYSGVDRLCALITPNKVGKLGHSSKKCWRHIFMYMLNLTLANTFVLFKLTSTRPNKAKVDNLAFRLELGTQMINGYTSRKQPVPNPKPTFEIDVANGHTLTRLPVKRARICRGHKRFFPNEKIRQTVYGCYQCGTHFCFSCFPLAHCK